MEGLVGLQGNQPDFGIIFAQEAPDTGERACCTQPGDKMGDLPAGLLHDFRAGGQVMRLPVGHVVVLVGVVKEVGLVGSHLARQADGTVRTFQRVGQDELDAQGVQDGDALGAGVGGMARVTGMPSAAPKVA